MLGWFLGGCLAHGIGRRATGHLVAERELTRVGAILAVRLSAAEVALIQITPPAEAPSTVLGMLLYPYLKLVPVALVGLLPVHRALAGFDCDVSPVDRKLVLRLADISFTAAAPNIAFIRGPGAGKSHRATAIGVAGITRHDRRVRFNSVVNLVNALEQEKVQGRAGRIAVRPHGHGRTRRAGYLPFSPARRGAAVARLCEHTSDHSTTKLDFVEWSTAFGDAKMTAVLPDQLTQHGHILETGNESDLDRYHGLAPMTCRSSRHRHSPGRLSDRLFHDTWPARGVGSLSSRRRRRRCRRSHGSSSRGAV